MHACIHVCTYVRMYVCIHACMYVSTKKKCVSLAGFLHSKRVQHWRVYSNTCTLRCTPSHAHAARAYTTPHTDHRHPQIDAYLESVPSSSCLVQLAGSSDFFAIPRISLRSAFLAFFSSFSCLTRARLSSSSSGFSFASIFRSFASILERCR